MADTRKPEARDHASAERGHGSANGMPRWVKVMLIVAIVLIALFLVSLLAGGRHGPGRHAPGDEVGGRGPSPVTEDHTPSGGRRGGHAPPAGEHP